MLIAVLVHEGTESSFRAIDVSIKPRVIHVGAHADSEGTEVVLSDQDSMATDEHSPCTGVVDCSREVVLEGFRVLARDCEDRVRCSYGVPCLSAGRVEGAAGAAAALLPSGRGRPAVGLMPAGCLGSGPVPGRNYLLSA